MATVTIQKYEGKKSMSYSVRYKDPFSRRSKHYKTYRRFKDANQAARELRTILDTGKSPEKKPTGVAPKTFEKIAALLMTEWDRKKARNEIKEKTVYDYTVWLNQINLEFGKMPLCEISKGTIEHFLNKIADQTSNVNANKHLSIFKKVFKCGLKTNALFEDVANGIKFFSEKKHERNKFLFPNELGKLVSATQKTRAKFYMPSIIFLGAEHGASKQEILSLEWSDIDFDFQQLGLIRFFRTKNNRERTEFLMPRTKKALREWKNHLIEKRCSDNIINVVSNHVFCRINGTPIKNFNRAWWAALNEAGIKDFHFHDLRHTFCSNLLLSGAGLKDAKEMIGHSDISMTDRYSHLSNQHKVKKQVALAKHYIQK